MTTLISVGSSVALHALCAEKAAQAGLKHLSFAGEEDTLAYLNADAPCRVLCIAQALASGNGIRLVQSVRREPRRAALPIVFVLDDDGPTEEAAVAMQAGASEVIPRPDSEMLTDFLAHIIDARDAPSLKGHVLLVEDNDAQAIFVTRLLNAIGLSVDRRSSVDEAEALLGNPYDIIIIDVILEGVRSGISLLQSIRQHTINGHVPVLMMSAYDDMSRRINIFRSGADDYIGKPFAIEEFICRVRRLLEMPGPGAATQGAENPAPELADQGLLTIREKDICSALMRGLSDKQIVQELGISYWTVRSHVQSIFSKMNVVNRRELMVRLLDSNRQ